MPAQQERAQSFLFTNVNVFDGKSERLINTDVLVVGNKIDKVSTKPIAASANMTVIDGAGSTLMPGLIDSHVHINMYKNGTLLELQNTTWEEIGARSAAFAEEMLAMGFTTMRDMCGAHEGLKKVIDEGLLPGPRLYLSGACISQTSAPTATCCAGTFRSD